MLAENAAPRVGVAHVLLASVSERRGGPTRPAISAVAEAADVFLCTSMATQDGRAPSRLGTPAQKKDTSSGNRSATRGSVSRQRAHGGNVARFADHGKTLRAGEMMVELR